jgi:DNA primase large subunit
VASIHGMKYEENSNVTIEILSFFIALVMLRLTNVSYFCKKFALYEAKKSERHMENDLIKTPAIINTILKEFFGIEMINDGNNYKIKIADYLKHSINFNDLPWKLVNRRVNKGYVFLTRHECVRLLRHELQHQIYERIMKSPKVKNEPMFQTYIAKLIEKAEQFNILPPNILTDVPPCVKHALNVMENGENLSHSGRFLIATFYMSRGADIDDVLQYFKKVPDFNDKVTRYQLNKIKQGEYKCPGCDKLNTQNLCYKTDECGYIKNPLSFRKQN